MKHTKGCGSCRWIKLTSWILQRKHKRFTASCRRQPCSTMRPRVVIDLISHFIGSNLKSTNNYIHTKQLAVTLNCKNTWDEPALIESFRSFLPPEDVIRGRAAEATRGTTVAAVNPIRPYCNTAPSSSRETTSKAAGQIPNGDPVSKLSGSEACEDSWVSNIQPVFLVQEILQPVVEQTRTYHHEDGAVI